MINMKVSGARNILNNMKKLGADVDKIEKQSVFATSNAIKNTAIKSIQNQSFGSYVTRYSQGGKPYSHIAAKAGQAPNTDTGDLVKSINTQPLAPAKTMYVGVNADHGVWLEFGTRNMAARPFMQPAIKENEDYLEDYLAKKLKALIA